MEFNLYLREIIFVTNVAVQTNETIKLVFKPLSFDTFEIRKKGTSARKVTFRDTRGCCESLWWGAKHFWQRRWKTCTSLLTTAQKYLVLWTTPKTLEPSGSDYKFKVGYTHEKSNCPVSNTSMPLSAPSTMFLPSVQWQKKMKLWWGTG